MDALETVIRLLFSEQKDLLINRYRDHALKGDLRGFRELHIEADWLLIYRIDRDVLTLVLIETGSHDDLFG